NRRCPLVRPHRLRIFVSSRSEVKPAGFFATFDRDLYLPDRCLPRHVCRRATYAASRARPVNFAAAAALLLTTLRLLAHFGCMQWGGASCGAPTKSSSLVCRLLLPGEIRTLARIDR